MRLSRVALAGALSAAVVLTGLVVSSADAATLAPEQMTCFEAQQQLTLDQHTLITKQAADRSEDNTAVNGSADFTPDVEDVAVNNAQAVVNTDIQDVNALCGTTGGVGLPVPTPNPGMTCAQLAALGSFPAWCGGAPAVGVIQTVGGSPCVWNGASWVRESSIPVGTVWTIAHQRRHWTGTAFIPVDPVPVGTGSCGCAPTPAPAAPAPSQPTNINTNTINITPTSLRVASSSTPAGSSEPSTITVPPVQTGPSYSQIGGTAPAGAAEAGFGGMADAIDPNNPNPDPTVQLTVNLGNLLNLGTLPSLPGLSGSSGLLGLPL